MWMFVLLILFAVFGGTMFVLLSRTRGEISALDLILTRSAEYDLLLWCLLIVLMVIILIVTLYHAASVRSLQRENDKLDESQRIIRDGTNASGRRVQSLSNLGNGQDPISALRTHRNDLDLIERAIAELEEGGLHDKLKALMAEIADLTARAEKLPVSEMWEMLERLEGEKDALNESLEEFTDSEETSLADRVKQIGSEVRDALASITEAELQQQAIAMLESNMKDSQRKLAPLTNPETGIEATINRIEELTSEINDQLNEMRSGDEFAKHVNQLSDAKSEIDGHIADHEKQMARLAKWMERTAISSARSNGSGATV